MPELIDRAAAIDKMCGDCKSGYDGHCPHPLGMCHELESLFSVPTIDAAPVRHGRWIPEPGEPDWYRCSCCKKNTIYSTDKQDMETFEAFCSRCGADMRGGVENG